MCRVKLDLAGGKSEVSFHFQEWGEIMLDTLLGWMNRK